MHRNINKTSLITDQRGAVAIEFIVVSLFLIGMLSYLIDLVYTQAMATRLDRIAYSTAGIVRERTRLYDGKDLNQAQVNQLAEVAKNMLPAAQRSNLIMTVDRLDFEDIDPGKPDAPKVLLPVNPSYSNPSSVTCTTNGLLAKQMDLAPKSFRPRWIPLYKVNICLSIPSLLPGVGASELKSYAIMVSR